MDTFLDIKIKKKRGARIVLNGDLIISSHLMGTSPVRIIIKEGGLLTVENKFIIGNGVKIFIEKDAKLEIGGKLNESESGITSDTLIMVYKSIRIGYDFIGAWNLFISDSDWHTIVGGKHHKDVIIGNHVWIANSVNVLKGSIIGNGCIIGSNSKVGNQSYENNKLIVGPEGKVLKGDVEWTRDIN